MFKKSVRAFATIAALVLGFQSACAQGGPTSGLYQIMSGRYTACCGIAGPLINLLPDASQAFILLTVDQQKNLAQMTVLGQDMNTVLNIAPEASRSGFTYVFTNGLVFPDHIQFEVPFLPPMPYQPYFRFVVSNLTDKLIINGTVTAPCPGCADIPQEFQHTNAVAVLVPTATIRVSEVEVCWGTASNRTYQVQYRSTLTTNAWTNLGSSVIGTGSTQCLTDKVPLAEPQRVYRVSTLP